MVIIYYLETNAWNGIRNYYTDLGRALESYSEDELKVAAPLKPKQNRNFLKILYFYVRNYIFDIWVK